MQDSVRVPLLVTKHSLPPMLITTILRPRLLERLNGGMTRKLALVSAPAGSGKTTLIASWVASLQRSGEAGPMYPVAWLTLDTGDNTVSQFLSYLVTALERIAPEIGTSVIPLLQLPQVSPMEVVLTALCNALLCWSIN